MTDNIDREPIMILGGGVIGLSLAYELACRNAGSVTVVEAQPKVGRGASWAGAGILPACPLVQIIDPLDQLRFLSHRLHPVWAQKLFQETGIDTGFRRSGGIYLARSAGESATLVASKYWWKEHGIEAQEWSSAQIRQLAPALATLVDSGQLKQCYFLPDECQIRNPRHLQALVQACRQRGVRIIENCDVEQLVCSGGQVKSARCKIDGTSTQLVAKQYCICSGAWARTQLDQLGIVSGMLPVRGQMVLYQTQPTWLKQIINEGHRYLVARDDGRLLAGSCEEEVGFDIQTTPDIIAELQAWATSILPQLSDTPIEATWAGLRPGSYDGWPYLGKVPGLENLYMAAGHYRSGLHLSCATAVVMADLLQGHPMEVDITPFRVSRG